MNNVCVFCGSSPGAKAEHMASAGEFGGLLAQRGVGVVYGGGNSGLMGAVAAAALAGGGRLLGVIPRALVDAYGPGFALPGETVVVANMHERKALMAARADAFAALPGGVGTFEELLECLTWSQLGIHAKPIVVLNSNGFYDPLRALMDKAVEEGFMRPENRDLAVFVATPSEAVDALFNYKLPEGRFEIPWTDPARSI
ncbi:hypothetical protein BDR26DRAFT_1005108 [Obelidium mucronatum]|nr:hypothetical protein BDR26DRAFT_1005108 [Obelidium mucronatum]